MYEMIYIFIGIIFFIVLLLSAAKITVEGIALALLVGLVPGLLLALASR
jgi:hypothetical protein